MRPYLALKLTHTLSVSWPDKILYNTRTWSSTHVLHSLKLLQMSSGLYRDVKLQDGGSIRPIIGWLLHRNTLSAIAAMAVSTLLFFCQSLARSNFINTYRFSQNEKKINSSSYTQTLFLCLTATSYSTSPPLKQSTQTMPVFNPPTPNVQLERSLS